MIGLIDGPRRRSGKGERIGLLVDFFSAAGISERVVEVLAAGRDGYADLRQAARRTIVENYDLNSICLLAQLQLPEMAMNKYGGPKQACV